MATASRIRADPVFTLFADPIETRKAAAQVYALEHRSHSGTLRSEALLSSIAQLGT